MPNCFGLVFVMWCSLSTQPVTGHLQYCDGYQKPILLSHKDTRETKEQVDVRNRIFQKFCVTEK